MEPRSIERGEVRSKYLGGSKKRTASMEPRSIERGELAADDELAVAFLGFNGATFNRTWRVPLGTPASQRPHSFNGATFNRTWRDPGADQAGRGRVLLQWSHVQSNVERQP